MLKKKYFISLVVLIAIVLAGFALLQLTTKTKTNSTESSTKKVQPKPSPGYDRELSSKAPPANPNAKIPAASQAQTGSQPQPTVSAPKN